MRPSWHVEDPREVVLVRRTGRLDREDLAAVLLDASCAEVDVVHVEVGARPALAGLDARDRGAPVPLPDVQWDSDGPG